MRQYSSPYKIHGVKNSRFYFGKKRSKKIGALGAGAGRGRCGIVKTTEPREEE